MKVLFLASAFPPGVGGVDRYAANLARGLMLAGCHVRVLTTEGAADPAGITGVSVSRTPSWLNHKFLKLAPLTAAAVVLCLRERPDRVVALLWTHEGLTAALLRGLFGIDYCVLTHGSEVLQYRTGALYGRAMRFVLSRAALVVANSRFTRSLVIASGVPAERVAVVNPPVDVPASAADTRRVDARWGLDGCTVLFTAARLAARKGHAHVIQVLARLKDRYPSLRYVMTGDGECRAELADLASRLGVRDRVVMTGMVSDEDLGALFARADVYVSPSIEVNGDVEGFGIALAEAGACGVAVIAGRSGGVEDVVVDGSTGILVTPGDLAELEAAVTALLTDADRRRALGARARARIASELRVDRQGARLHACLA